MTAKSSRPSAWLDEKSNTPIVAEKARKLESFLTAAADGRIDDSEIKTQEAKLTALMKEIEPRLDDDLHAKVTELLCELTAYDLMHLMQALQTARPKAVFQG